MTAVASVDAINPLKKAGVFLRFSQHLLPAQLELVNRPHRLTVQHTGQAMFPCRMPRGFDCVPVPERIILESFYQFLTVPADGVIEQTGGGIFSGFEFTERAVFDLLFIVTVNQIDPADNKISFIPDLTQAHCFLCRQSACLRVRCRRNKNSISIRLFMQSPSLLQNCLICLVCARPNYCFSVY